MITVVVSGVVRGDTLSVSPDADQLLLSVSGHSGSAVKGADIICAGISTLVQSAGRFLASRKVRIEVERREGLMGLTVPLSGLSSENVFYAVCAFDLALGGMEMIAGSYPGSVEIRIVK